LKDNKYDVDNINSKKVINDLETFSKEKYGENVVLEYSNSNVFFNKEIIAASNLDIEEVKQSFKEFFYKQKFVRRVYTDNEILAASGSDMYLKFIANGYDPIQNGELVVLEKPGYLEYGSTGTTHGSPYTYDTHVPLIFYGWNITPGKSYKKKTITQIAPTLALKLKITLPNGTEAEVLEEILD
jgi:hypothetical protein